MNTLAQIGDLLTALIALGGFVALLTEYRRANAIKRSDFITQLIEKLRSDEDIREIMYEFQYGRFIYDDNFHGNTEYERKVDKALFYLSYICYLKEKRIISASDFSFFEIEVMQALRNDGVLNYLFNLYHYECYVSNSNPRDKKSEQRFTFYYLLKYAGEHSMIDDEFYDPKAIERGKFHHYLNF